LYDMNGGAFLDASSIAPRATVVFDPFNDGRSKISAGYGQFYEAIPMDLAARYFGGENFVARQSVPATACTGNEDVSKWTGNGEWTSCGIPPVGSMANDPAGSYFPTFNTAQ